MQGKVWLISLILFLATSKTDAILECLDDGDCFDNGECVRNKCECSPGKVYNSLGNQCVDLASGYGQECEYWEQCALLAGSYTCTNNKCACRDGWIYLMGKCIENKKLDDYCRNEGEYEECFDGMDYFARRCINNKCKCNTGYYNRAGIDCRRIRSIGQTCSINSDCQFQNGGCEGGICINKISPTREQREIRVDDEDDDDEPPMLIGIACNTHDDCPEISSYCSPLLKKCRCNEGYFEMGDACVPELGSQCSTGEDCVGIGVDCINDVCTCTDRYQHKEGNTRCVKVPFADAFWCSSTEACKIFGTNYICDTDKKCVCLPGYALNKNSVCQFAGGVGDICQSDEECNSKRKGSICDPTGACVCGDKFEYNDKTSQCDALLGGACGTIEDCKIENSVCRTNCTCADSFVQTGDKTCIAGVPELHQDCTMDIQCRSILTGSHCNNTQCECEQDYLEIDGVCLKKAFRVGDVCNNKQMCDVLGDGFVCRYGICQCAPNMKPASNGKRCEVRGNGVSIRVWSPTLFGGVAIAYSMVVGVFL